jgi:hypothetical protein
MLIYESNVHSRIEVKLGQNVKSHYDIGQGLWHSPMIEGGRFAYSVR